MSRHATPASQTPHPRVRAVAHRRIKFPISDLYSRGYREWTKSRCESNDQQPLQWEMTMQFGSDVRSKNAV